MKTKIRQLTSLKGIKYEVFYWLSKWTDWMGENNKIKQWIDNREYFYWHKWVTR